MLSLYIRNIVFFILQPGFVVGLVPYVLLRDQIKSILSERYGFLQYLGITLVILGIFMVLHCIYRFIIDGKGTLSPVDKTKSLVIRGLYRYSRNPMYVGVLLVLFGEVFFTVSLEFSVYTVLVGLAFHLFVIYVEEPRLTKDFKADYLKYMSNVNRWF